LCVNTSAVARRLGDHFTNDLRPSGLRTPIPGCGKRIINKRQPRLRGIVIANRKTARYRSPASADPSAAHQFLARSAYRYHRSRRSQELLALDSRWEFAGAPGSTGRFPRGFVLAGRRGQANWPDRSCGASTSICPCASPSPKDSPNMPEQVAQPEYATVVGLVLYGAKGGGGRRRSVPEIWCRNLSPCLPARS